jgi:Hemerythrin HHE cation binding domain
MSVLTRQLNDEHAKLMPHVDELRVIADAAPGLGEAALRDRVHVEHQFLVRDFVPHMDAEQETLHPVMARLLVGRRPRIRLTHAHDEIRGLIDALGALGEPAGVVGAAWLLETRRALYQLFALLKVHLAEEELFAPILEAELSEAEGLQLAAQLEFGAPPRSS